MTLLSETAHVLTHTHKRHTVTEHGDVWGDEPALLVTLAECVTNPSSNGGAGGNTTRAGLPINADALVLLTRIQDVVDTCWPGNGDPAYVRVPLHVKLNAWVVHTTDPVAEGVLLDLCQRWTAQVRELLEPTRKVPVPGVACPTCGWDKTYREDDGEFIPAPALVAYPEMVPVRVVCTVESCGAEWSGPAVTDTFMAPVTVDSDFM